MIQIYKCLILILVLAAQVSQGKAVVSTSQDSKNVQIKEPVITEDQFSSLLDSTLNFSDNPIKDCSNGTDIKNKLDPIRRAAKDIPELSVLENSSCNDLLKSVKEIVKAAKSRENSIVVAGTTDFFGLYKNGALIKTYQIPAGRTNANELRGIFGVKSNGPIQLVPLGSSANMVK